MSEVLVCCWLNSSGRSRPSDKGGGGSHPDPGIWGGGAPKNFFKHKGSPGPPGPPLDLPLELTLADIL